MDVNALYVVLKRSLFRRGTYLCFIYFAALAIVDFNATASNGELGSVTTLSLSVSVGTTMRLFVKWGDDDAFESEVDDPAAVCLLFSWSL